VHLTARCPATNQHGANTVCRWLATDETTDFRVVVFFLVIRELDASREMWADRELEQSMTD